MDRKRVDRFTSPAIGGAAAAAVIAIGFRPDLALPLLAAVEFAAGLGCALQIRTSLGFRPPAPSSAILFAALSFFWICMSSLSLWWFVQGR